MTIKELPLHANGHKVTGGQPEIVKTIESSVGIPFSVTHLFNCAGCGEYFSPRLADDGAYIDSPCAVTNGITTVTRLNVPSGKLIVSTDLRPAYDGYDHKDRVSYGSTLGVALTVEAFAEQGCAFGFVGDAWPDLFQTGENSYVLANCGWDEELDGPRAPEGWTKLADICGAVWSYSLADYEDWKARGGKDSDLEEFTVVEIPAGVYEFTYHGGETGFDRHAAGTVLFTHIKKVA
jgi:hypothetical protein